MALSMVAGCSSEGGEPGTNTSEVTADPALIWISPDATVTTADAVPLTVSAPNGRAVRFDIDGQTVFTCAAPDECRSGELVRWTTKLGLGTHTLKATVLGGGSSATRTLTVVAGEPEPPPDPSEDAEFIDPNRAAHNVFGGVFWSVRSQKVTVAAPPAASTAAVARCMARYGAGIRRQADRYRVSRASVVATALTESNCTNPTGSSDGLSSGPMQVTGSTCAALTGLGSFTCKQRMHQNPEFSFDVGARYMGSAYQRRQHASDPPKIAAAYNTGSIRRSGANRWHMLVTGNHIDRFVGANNAYARWAGLSATDRETLEREVLAEPESVFNGENVPSFDALPAAATDGQTYFVGDYVSKDGYFVEFRKGRWEPTLLD
jgi:hypothetical protein